MCKLGTDIGQGRNRRWPAAAGAGEVHRPPPRRRAPPAPGALQTGSDRYTHRLRSFSPPPYTSPPPDPRPAQPPPGTCESIPVTVPAEFCKAPVEH